MLHLSWSLVGLAKDLDTQVLKFQFHLNFWQEKDSCTIILTTFLLINKNSVIRESKFLWPSWLQMIPINKLSNYLKKIITLICKKLKSQLWSNKKYLLWSIIVLILLFKKINCWLIQNPMVMVMFILFCINISLSKIGIKKVKNGWSSSKTQIH